MVKVQRTVPYTVHTGLVLETSIEVVYKIDNTTVVMSLSVAVYCIAVYCIRIAPRYSPLIKK